MTFQRSFDSAAVIIAAFNAEKTIAETLNSIVAQTMAVGMVVVVDDDFGGVDDVDDVGTHEHNSDGHMDD